MPKRLIRRATTETDERYPSLREHLATRRRFLTVTGAGVAALGLGACTRGLGQHGDADAGTQPDARPPQPDAQPPQPDATIETPGEAPYPDYYVLRLPATGDSSAWLADNGYCTFWVQVATWVEASYVALQDNITTAVTRCSETLSDCTYDMLSTGTGVASAEDDLHDALETLVQELNQHEELTLEAVTLTITYLEDDAPIDGGMPEPSYPE